LSSAKNYANAAVKEGANIIDVGGFSTRPGSATITTKEELSRTVPFIEQLRKSSVEIPISIDSFRAEVAESALDAGANCINDVYGLTGPHLGVADTRPDDIKVDEHDLEVSDNGKMLKLAVKSKVPLILMHSRGAASQNKDYTRFGNDILAAVRSELGLRVSRALQEGVRRWNIVVDPGIGFSKTVGDNFTLIRDHARLTMDGKSNTSPILTLPKTPRINMVGFPTLAGTSRKGFLGKIIKRESDVKERDWATAAAVTSLIQQGTDIVRVHAVREMTDVVLVADAIWRHKDI
jgi:dihydroneopterin aldolase/2-amino-4-hydroxy-6-hydroxymethyldihydropteridine diphosphokinase/dihydropteroate synthase